MFRWKSFLAVFAMCFASIAFMLCAFAFVINVEPAYGQHGSSGRYSNTFVTHEYEEVASTTGVVNYITPVKINTEGLQKTQRAYITFTGQGVRWTADGSTPSTGLGIPVPNGASIELVSLEDIQNFKFINDDDVGSAVAHISLQYEKEMN